MSPKDKSDAARLDAERDDRRPYSAEEPRGRGESIRGWPDETVQTPPPPGPKEAVPIERSVVLVVDDDPAVLVATVDLVESLGYRALRARGGEEALGLLDRTAAVDVLMTDLGLGRGMSGRDLAQEAVARRPALKVLYASGNTGRPPADTAAILKPYTLKELEQRLGALLARGADLTDGNPPGAEGATE